MQTVDPNIISPYPMTPQAERDRRYAALRAAMAEGGIDALVIAARGDGFLRGRLHYVSDVHLWAGRILVVLPLQGEPVLIGEPLWGISRAQVPGWITDNRLSATPGAEAATALRELGLSRGAIAIAGLDSAMAVEDLRQLDTALPEAHLSDGTGLFDTVRSIKSEVEIERLRETSQVLKRAMKAIEVVLAPGVTERAAMAAAHETVRAFGCLDGIAIMGRTPFRSFNPGTTAALEPDDVIGVDLEWQGPSGYWLELRRVYSFKPPSDEQRRFWEMRVEMQARCVEAMKPGVASSELLNVIADICRKHGYEPPHTLGYSAHGIGIDCLEPPWVPGKDVILQEGMVVSLHPHAGFRDAAQQQALSGIGIADNVLVTPTGGERLTDEVDEWIILG